jgi:hypothetical protein
MSAHACLYPTAFSKNMVVDESFSSIDATFTRLHIFMDIMVLKAYFIDCMLNTNSMTPA